MTNIDYIETLFPVQAADCVYMERASFVGELILANKWLDLLLCGFRHQVELSRNKILRSGLCFQVRGPLVRANESRISIKSRFGLSKLNDLKIRTF